MRRKSYSPLEGTRVLARAGGLQHMIVGMTSFDRAGRAAGSDAEFVMLSIKYLNLHLRPLR